MKTTTKPSVLSLILLTLLLSTLQLESSAQTQTTTLSNGQKVVLYADKTWDYQQGLSYDFDFSTLADNQIPEFLRQGINVGKQTLVTAVEMYLQGWRYTMPRPKSNQAAWGNTDGRTTWYNGYWYNNKTKKHSRSTPLKKSNGYYYGDKQNDKNTWSNGGSPSYPSKIDWLLSSHGGVNPY